MDLNANPNEIHAKLHCFNNPLKELETFAPCSRGIVEDVQRCSNMVRNFGKNISALEWAVEWSVQKILLFGLDESNDES